MALRLLLLIIVFTSNSSAEADFTIKCPKNHHCISLSRCHNSDSNSFIYPCHHGLNMICCPVGSYKNSTSLETRKASLFPINCGLVMHTDKITAGKVANYGQFPWMSLLGYRQRGIDFTQFLCGGSVITENYVLTAAHCINLDPRLELVVVRLGEHDLLTEKDCFKVKGFENFETCAEPHVDILIQRVVIHEMYNDNNLHNDIALVKTRKKIKFTDYIRPICLPFDRNLERNLTKQKLTVSGWGKTDASNLGGSNTLQFAPVIVWDQTNCSRNVPPEVKPIVTTQLCANGPAKEDACKGDSGGPLVTTSMGSQAEPRYFQIGIVSFSSTLTCGDPSSPTVYTRVDKFLDWVQENIS